jgi:nitrogen fixation-related uncharacterized protein
MDPVMLSSLMHALIPIISVLAVFGAPVGIVWVVKNHQYRMKELDLEANRPSARVEERLAAIEARLSRLEGGEPAPRNSLQDRAAMLEPPPVPVRER